MSEICLRTDTPLPLHPLLAAVGHREGGSCSAIVLVGEWGHWANATLEGHIDIGKSG